MGVNNAELVEDFSLTVNLCLRSKLRETHSCYGANELE